MTKKKNGSKVTQLRESPDCLLFKLPGELRNSIYELLFNDGNDAIHALEATPPTENGRTANGVDTALLIPRLKFVKGRNRTHLSMDAMTSSFSIASVTLEEIDTTSQLSEPAHRDSLRLPNWPSIATDPPSPSSVQLDPPPPSSALLRCCRRLHTEARSIFATAYSRYWNKILTCESRYLPQWWSETVCHTFVMKESHDLTPATIVLSLGEDPSEANNDIVKSNRALSTFRRAMAVICYNRYLSYLRKHPYDQVQVSFKLLSEVSPEERLQYLLLCSKKANKRSTSGANKGSRKGSRPTKEAEATKGDVKSDGVPATQVGMKHSEKSAGDPFGSDEMDSTLQSWCRSWNMSDKLVTKRRGW